MKLSHANRICCSFLFLVFADYAKAECLSTEPHPLTCPVDVQQLHNLKKMKDCRSQQVGSSSCIDELKKSASADPVYGFLGFTNAAKMTPAERAQAIRDFFKQRRADLVEQVGRSEFETRVRAGRQIPDNEIRGLLREYRAHQLRIRMNPNNAQLKSSFIAFKERNKESFQVVSRLYDARRPPGANSFYEDLDGKGIQRIRFKAYRPMLVGGFDVANADWDTLDNMPDKVTGIDGRSYDTRGLYKNQAERVVDELEQQMLRGKSLNQAFDSSAFQSWGYDAKQKRSLAMAVRDVGLRSQIEAGRGLTSAHLSGAQRIRAETSRGTLKKGRLKIGRLGLAGTGMILGGALAVGQIVIENQASCDRAFPHVPTRYRQAFTTGLPDEMRCEMQMPVAGAELPGKVSTWLYGNELDAIDILNSSEGGNSPCTYVTRLYNENFCDGTESAVPADGGVE